MDRAISTKPSGMAEAADDRRRSARRHVLWRGVLQTGTGPYPCLVLNVSLGGAKLAVKAALKVDQPVTLMLGALGTFRAVVVWAEVEDAGVRFVEGPNQQELARRLGGLPDD